MLRRRYGAILAVFACVVVSAQVREMETPQTREQQVRDLIERFNLAYEQKDVQSISGLVVSDLTAFAAGRVFSNWDDYNNNFLQTAFSRHMPASTWQIEKVVTVPEMAWAYTKTTYTLRRQNQQIQADLYQLFVLRKTSTKTPQLAKSKSSNSTESSWKIAVIDYTFHREEPNNQNQPDTSKPGSQPK